MGLDLYTFVFVEVTILPFFFFFIIMILCLYELFFVHGSLIASYCLKIFN